MGPILHTALISTLLSVGSQVGSGSDEDQLLQDLHRGSSDGVSQGRAAACRSLDIRPTITIQPGFPVRLIVPRAFVLEPWRS